MKGQNVKDLQKLSAFHPIAFCTQKKFTHIQFSKENFENIVAQILKIRPEYESYPIGTICVLGSNDKGYRQLYTDLLIHYFKNKRDKNAIDEWQGQWGKDCSLCYIPSTGQRHEESGLHIWPVPYLVQQEQKKFDGKIKVEEMLLWVIFVDGNNSQILDNICTLTSSNIVTLKESETRKIQIFWKNADLQKVSANPRYITNDALALLNSPKPLINKVWHQLIDNIEKKPIQTKKFQDSELTLKTFLPFLENLQEIVPKICECTTASVPYQSMPNVAEKFEEELFITVLNDHTQEELKVSDAESLETSSEQNKPNTKHMLEPEPIQAEKVEEISPEKAIEMIRSWIQNEMSITNVKTMMEDLHPLNIMHEQSSLKSDLRKIHNIFMSFNGDLTNMFDNYVCFHGIRDYSQMSKFMETIYERAKQSWESNMQDNQSMFDIDILESVRKNLFGLYKDENNEIIRKEESIIQNVVEKTEATFMQKLELFINEIEEHDQDFEVVSKKMKTECTQLVRRALDYGGKLNNVLFEASTRMDRSLNERVSILMTTNKTNPSS